MKMIYNIFYLIIFLFSVFLVSCSKDNKKTAGEQKKAIQVNYWIWSDDSHNDIIKILVNKFNKENNGIEVNLKIINWDSYYDTLRNSVLSKNNFPDVAAFKILWFPEFNVFNTLEPLNNYINDWKKKDDIEKSIWTMIKNVSADGKIYLMPWEIQVLYMYYRPSLFKKAGITNIPQTWHEWLIAAEKLTIDTDEDGRLDQYGFGMRGGRYGHEPWGSFVFANVKGNKIIVNRKAMFDTKGGRKGNKLFIDLYRKYKVVPPSAPSDGLSEIMKDFLSGKTAMMIHHIKSSQKMVAVFGDDVDAFPVPAGEFGRWTSLGDTENVIFKNSKNKKAAFKFISWLSEKNQIDTICRKIGNIPIVHSLQNEEWYKKNKFIKVSIESLGFARIYPINEKMSGWTEEYWPMVTKSALEGKITPDLMLFMLAQYIDKKSREVGTIIYD